MKKFLTLLLVLVLAGSLTLTGCSSNDEPDNTNAILQQMVDEAQETLDAMQAAMGDTMSIDITVRGNAMVYTYTLLMDMGDTADVKEGLEAGMDAQRTVFESLVEQLHAEGAEGASIIIEYLDMDGNVLLSEEFK